MDMCKDLAGMVAMDIRKSLAEMAASTFNKIDQSVKDSPEHLYLTGRYSAIQEIRGLLPDPPEPVACLGRVRLLGYRCALSPGHAGKCYSALKSVEFDPENEVGKKCE